MKASDKRGRAFRELISSDENRVHLRKRLTLPVEPSLPPRLTSLLEELERREHEQAKERPKIVEVALMAFHWFDPPVPVSGEEGMTCEVNNVEAASDHLLKWTKRGPKWNKAVRVCMAAMADQATPQEVRRCFRLAAKEEGALIA